MAKKNNGYNAEVENLWHALRMNWSDKDVASVITRVVERIMDGEGCTPFVDTQNLMPAYAAGWYWAQVSVLPGREGRGAQDLSLGLHLYFPFKKEPRGLGAVEGLNEYDVNPDVVYVRVAARINGTVIKRLVLLTTDTNESKKVIRHFSELLNKPLSTAFDCFLEERLDPCDDDEELGPGEYYFTAKTPVSYVPLTIKRALKSGAPRRIAAVYDKWWFMRNDQVKSDVDYQNALSLY